MKKLLLFAAFALVASAQTITVQPVILNTPLMQLIRVALGTPPTVLVFVGDPARDDGFHVTISGADMVGNSFTMTQDQPISAQSQSTAVVFVVDAASLTSVKVTPYRLDQSRTVSIP